MSASRWAGLPSLRGKDRRCIISGAGSRGFASRSPPASARKGFTSGECLRQFWFSSSLLCLLLAHILCQSTGDGNEQQEHGHVILLHGCSWNRGEKLHVVVPPRLPLALRHTADKDGWSGRSSHKYAAGWVRAEMNGSRQGPGLGGASRKCEVCLANCHEGPGCFLLLCPCRWAVVLLRCALMC